MKFLLTICTATAILTAIWATTIFVWLFVGLGISCAVALGVTHRDSELSSLIASAFFIAAGFIALHTGIATMATDTLRPQVTTFAAPVVLVLTSCLLFCIALVERNALNATETPPKLKTRRLF